MTSILEKMELDEARYMDLLKNLIGESKYLQNSPSQGLIPQEDLAVKHIMDVLRPFSKEMGGVLEIEQIAFVEGRSNLIIKYPGSTDAVVSFVGSHLDVVPADPSGWDRDPFKLIQEGICCMGEAQLTVLGMWLS